MNNLCKLTAVLAFFLVSPAFAGGDTKGSGGHWTDRGEKLIKKASLELLEAADTNESDCLTQNESRREVLKVALQHIVIKSNEERSRDDRALLLDYNVSSTSIIVLKKFFEVFNANSYAPETLTNIKRLLLHEASHLWGFKDDDAETFADNFLSYPYIPTGEYQSSDGDQLTISANGRVYLEKGFTFNYYLNGTELKNVTPVFRQALHLSNGRLSAEGYIAVICGNEPNWISSTITVEFLLDEVRVTLSLPSQATCASLPYGKGGNHFFEYHLLQQKN